MAAVGSRSRRPHAHSGCIVGAAAGFADAGGGAGQDARANGPRCRAKSRARESWREERVRRDLPAQVAASEEPPALSGFYFVKRRRVVLHDTLRQGIYTLTARWDTLSPDVSPWPHVCETPHKLSKIALTSNTATKCRSAHRVPDPHPHPGAPPHRREAAQRGRPDVGVWGRALAGLGSFATVVT